ncbi:Mitochondrial peroxiredoxin with thioredoxin peroxidase activity [Malassezia sympodialis ATCC 42132]|uniref:Mitochondrial peroxiredoxin with thioredoxin peroxidase activity n=1 Tax=Malassezia sympodialis (strain ATCC 42132) TaxID=1230383 RepID=A0A1M8A1S6_MALS4|nr:Mitochondrial peroxiredoxin with thioredoxin peroxidase activity [Malassezia sympodialis ATCC 42132]
MTALRLGSVAPDFEAQSTEGKIRFHSWMNGSWTILFSHPDDFTPVCTTEFCEIARCTDEFHKRGVKVIGLSINDVNSHQSWVKDIEAIAGHEVTFPILADPDRKIATQYDMLDALDPTNVDALGNPLTVRDVFVIDPRNIIRLKLSYPASTGRNFNEILRIIDSLQLVDQQSVTTPANWEPGQNVIIHPSVSDEQASKQFPGFTQVRPYLRYTHDPINRKLVTRYPG